MAKLVIETGMRKGAEFTLGDKPLVIGREPDCDICIPDRMASRQHVKISREGGGFVAEDLQSRNGSLINNGPLTRATLKDGDEVVAGTTVLRFRAVGEAASVAPALSASAKARGNKDTVAAPSGFAATRPPPDVTNSSPKPKPPPPPPAPSPRPSGPEEWDAERTIS